MKAVALITEKNAGVAKAYADTFAGQFQRVRDSINETVEAIGGAIGGGEGLPTFKRLLEGIMPVVEDLVGEVNKNLPNIQRFSRELVEKFLAKLPGYVATAKRELPALIDKAKEFIGSVAGFAKELAAFLGPEGLITAGIGILGTKMGGLAGGLGAMFSEQFIKMGIDPITATLTGTIGGAITAGVIQGLGSSLAQAAITKFLGLFKNISVTPSIPTTVPGTTPGTTVVPGGNKGGGVLQFLGKAAVALPIIGFILGEAKRIADETAAKEKEKRDAAPGTFEEVKKIWAAQVPTFQDSVTKGVTDGFKVAPMQAPIDLTTSFELKLDGQVIAESVDRRLGITAALNNGGRVNYRGPR
jgi:hypothetical protein